MSKPHHKAEESAQPFRPQYPRDGFAVAGTTTGRIQGKTPRTAQDDTLEITFTIKKEHAPALRAAIEEIRNRVGTRMEGSYKFEIEDALVRGSCALAALAAAVSKLVPANDPHWRGAK